LPALTVALTAAWSCATDLLSGQTLAGAQKVFDGAFFAGNVVDHNEPHMARS
jgi:hypothetical protein